MSLSTLISGADCGPSNALQSLTKRVDVDRGVQGDLFGVGRAGPSRPTFRTTVAPNAQLNSEKTGFFNAATRPIEPLHLQRSPFDMQAMQQALSGPGAQESARMHNSGPMMTAAFESSLKAESQMGDWAVDFMRQADPMMKAPSQPVVQASALNPVHNVQSYIPQHHMLRPMMPMHMHAPPISTSMATNANQATSVNWEQEFLQQSQSMETTLGHTAENPLVIDGDELSRTAGLLMDSLKDEENPKFKNSEFMGFMRQLRDKELVVEGDKLVPGSEATSATARATTSQAHSTGVPSQTRSTRERSGTIEDWPMKAVHFNPVTTVTNPIESQEEMSEEDVYWAAENRDYKNYWEKAAMLPSTSTSLDPTPQQREWDQLQESWDSWEATAEGMKQVSVPNYPFQTNNPYVFDRRHNMSNWRSASSNDQSILEMEAEVLDDPQNATAWFNLGVKQQANEREDKAIQALRKAVELDPSMLSAWMELSVSYTNDGNREAAYTAINEWISRNPRYSETVARWRSGKGSSALPKAEELIDCLVNMARSSTDGELDADVQIALGVLLNTTEEYEKAKDCFQVALEVRPDDYLLYNRIGATIANHGQPQDAIPYYNKALALNPSYIRARFNLGISCINLRKNEEAANHILDALVLQENDGLQTGQERGITSSTLWETLRSVCVYLQRQDLARICDRRDLNRFRTAFQASKE
ncbi:TPR-like protein [Serendipita vermifera]|nr:TPR-like protein [Serendipita vermifera]